MSWKPSLLPLLLLKHVVYGTGDAPPIQSANHVVCGAGKGPHTVILSCSILSCPCFFLAVSWLIFAWCNACLSSAKHVVCVAGKGPLDEGSFRGACPGSAVAAVPRCRSGCSGHTGDPICLNIVLIINLVSKRQRLVSYVCRNFG